MALSFVHAFCHRRVAVCRPPPSFLPLSVSSSVAFNPFPIKVAHLPKMLQERRVPLSSCFCGADFRTKWRDLSVRSAMDGWLLGPGRSRLKLDSVSDETKRAECVLGFAQKMDITAEKKPLRVEYPFRYSLPLVSDRKKAR